MDNERTQKMISRMNGTNRCSMNHGRTESSYGCLKYFSSWPNRTECFGAPLPRSQGSASCRALALLRRKLTPPAGATYAKRTCSRGHVLRPFIPPPHDAGTPVIEVGEREVGEREVDVSIMQTRTKSRPIVL